MGVSEVVRGGVGGWGGGGWVGGGVVRGGRGGTTLSMPNREGSVVSERLK